LRSSYLQRPAATIRFTSPVSNTPPPAHVGEHVQVRYPDNSQDATIDQYWQVGFLPTRLGIIATTLLLVGIAFGRRHV
jgi:hypothetical protein